MSPFNTIISATNKKVQLCVTDDMTSGQMKKTYSSDSSIFVIDKKSENKQINLK